MPPDPISRSGSNPLVTQAWIRVFNTCATNHPVTALINNLFPVNASQLFIPSVLPPFFALMCQNIFSIIPDLFLSGKSTRFSSDQPAFHAFHPFKISTAVCLLTNRSFLLRSPTFVIISSRQTSCSFTADSAFLFIYLLKNSFSLYTM